MNHHAKRLMRDLEALGFRRDHEAQTAGIAYRHPNQPDQVLKVFDRMTDNTITAVIRKANKIADTGWSGPRQPQTIKERARVTRSKERAAEDASRAEYERRRDEAAQRSADARAAAESAKREREIRDLMRPGYGR